MAKETKVEIKLETKPEVKAPPVVSDTVNKAQLRSSFEYRLAAGLTAMQAFDTAINQIEKDEADAAAKRKA